MTTNFKPDEWIESLSQALSELAAEQESHWNELRRQDQSQYFVHDQEYRDLSFLYSAAMHELTRVCDDLKKQNKSLRGTMIYETKYTSLCIALFNVRDVLARHPVWVPLVKSSDGSGHFWTHMVGHSHCGTLFHMISGLMIRAVKMGKDGFLTVATELNELIMPRDDVHWHPVTGDLSTGYHIGLFYGLSINEEIKVSDNISLVPLKHMAAFVSPRDIVNIVPSITNTQSWNSIGAIVESFRWKPKFYPENSDTNDRYKKRPSLSFLENAPAFIELLAMFHEIPVILLTAFPDRIHHDAGWLMGGPPIQRRRDFGLMSRSFANHIKPCDIDPNALKKAVTAFRKRDGDNYKNCAPAIARLAEALARRGRFQDDDKILDVAIALEQIYELGSGEISYKLKTRAACFLETSREARFQIFKDIEELYDTRSKILHRKNKELSVEEKSKAFEKGFKIARNSIIKLLRDSRLDDWNKIVIGGT